MHMPKSANPDELLSTAQVAALRGVHVTTVNRWVQAGKLTPAVKGPGRTGANLYRRGDLDALSDVESMVAAPEVAS